MENILDASIFFEESFLEELVQDLDSTLSMIFGAGKISPSFIKSRQNYLKRRYRHLIDYIQSDVGIFHVIPAYDNFQELLYFCDSPEDRKREAEEIWQEHIQFPYFSEELYDPEINPFFEF